jgi:putative peptidoglycan lipid II flippase
MAPSIALMAVTTFHEYLCQYDERYVTVILVRMTLPLVNLAALLVLGPRIGEYSLPVGYTAGHLAAFVLMAGFARYRFRPRLTFRRHLEMKIFSNSAVVMSTGLFARSKSLFVNYFASLLGDGVIAAIALATKVTEPMQRSAFYAARMVMFSRTARLFRDGDSLAIARLYELGMKASFLILAPLLWWLGLHAHSIVLLLFGRGAVDADKVVLISSILIALAPSVVFLGVNQLLSNAFYAMDRIRVPALLMPVGTMLYALGAGPAAAAFGAPGLTLTTSLVSALLFGALIVLFGRQIAGFRTGRTLSTLIGFSLWAGACLVGCNRLAELVNLGGLTAAAVVLPLGTLLYGLTLFALRDATLLRILADSGRIVSRSPATPRTL